MTAAAVSRVDSRATGSALSGLAMSSWKASQSDEQAPAEPPVAAIRLLSMFHSPAFERRNCTALRGVLQRPLHRRLDPGRLGLRGEAIVDRRDRDPAVEQLLEVSHADLVAVDPAAAMDVDDERGGLLGVGLEEVEHLPLVLAVGDVGKRRRHAIPPDGLGLRLSFGVLLLLGFRLFLHGLGLRSSRRIQDDHASEPGDESGGLVTAGERNGSGHGPGLREFGGLFEVANGELNSRRDESSPGAHAPSTCC